MSRSTAFDRSSFLELQATDLLPSRLRESMPAIMWLPRRLVREPGPPEGQAVLVGASQGSAPVMLATIGPDGKPRTHFSAEGVVNGILLEDYHAGLEPTAEMRLPFNYSRLPTWLKRVGRAVRLKAMGPAPADAIAFPPPPTSFAVDWVRDLAAWAGEPARSRSFGGGWPHGNRGALMITHDVDTDWLFHHPAWLERICAIESDSGLAGAWYCVPRRCRTPTSHRAIERLMSLGCEIGCHGYNHDAKLPLLEGPAFERRMRAIREFVARWDVTGFRSEWLWRTPRFLTALASVFEYDSSVPASNHLYSSPTGNGSSTCLPYVTHGGLLELPLTLPMDEARHAEGGSAEEFWERQVSRAVAVIERGGLAVVSLHPQQHQAANEETLGPLARALGKLARVPSVWRARPDAIARWVREN